MAILHIGVNQHDCVNPPRGHSPAVLRLVSCLADRHIIIPPAERNLGQMTVKRPDRYKHLGVLAVRSAGLLWVPLGLGEID
jgi:hypothetical protein